MNAHGSSKTLVVIRPHTRSYDNPIKLCRGESVEIVKSDPSWPGWLWCRTPTGLAGWVPEDILEKSGKNVTAREDYDATELTVAVGDQLKFIKEKKGWVWCEAKTGERGWVPKKAVATIEAYALMMEKII
jgi:hypothetical protein